MQVDVEAGAAAERAFFDGRKAEYGRLMHRCTTARLASILNAALVRHIHATLPDIKNAIRKRIANVEAELDCLGDPVDSLPSHRRGE